METKIVKYISLAEQYAQLHGKICSQINEVLGSGMFVSGEKVEQFEEQFATYLNCKHCVTVNSGTDALKLALRALEIGQGDKVIVPGNSFIASAGAVAEVGAEPVFADVAEDMNIEPAEIERLADCAKAVVVVHLTGRPANMERIMKTAGDKKLFVVEDCAQAVGASIEGRKVGTFGDAGCFSFHPLKTLNCAGDGGAIAVNSTPLAAKLKMLRNHGLSDREHCHMWGVNSRLDAIQAAILSVNLEYLEDWTRERILNAIYYSELLKDVVTVPLTMVNTRSVYHTYIIQTDYRDELKYYLENCGIETKIHYPICLHKQKAAGRRSELCMCETQAKRILSLPVHQYLSQEQISYVIEKIRWFFSHLPLTKRLL